MAYSYSLCFLPVTLDCEQRQVDITQMLKEASFLTPSEMILGDISGSIVQSNLLLNCRKGKHSANGPKSRGRKQNKRNVLAHKYCYLLQPIEK